MARPAISEVVKIRKAIIALPEDDFRDLIRDIGIIEEMRDELAKAKLKGNPDPWFSKGEADPITTITEPK